MRKVAVRCDGIAAPQASVTTSLVSVPYYSASSCTHHTCSWSRLLVHRICQSTFLLQYPIVSHCVSALVCTVCCRLNGGGGVTPGTSGSDPFITLNKSQRSQGSGSAGASIESETIILPLDDSERILGLQMALKCSDVGHVTAALPVHLK